ncbi:MmcQ/YjbR family DNA-binding protein [Microbacterium sp. 179-B 1A2 NHS]|uniref:MmcQ/YjbR family DNA-binding protein n=1 Tax=Microbacterium sp. 179-B 1A2 NHS TaxID=3142383 RepID=UPI0039A2B322
MNGSALVRRVHARTRELPGAELTHPFGPEWDVYKVRGRVFLLLTELRGQQVVTLKTDPEDSRALREAYPDITPGYHMNKKHWITVHPGGALDAGLLDDLVTDSYLLVVENLPKRTRPVDPAAFARDRS